MKIDPLHKKITTTAKRLRDADEFDQDEALRYRGSYMSAHVLLNLLNELGKRDKMRCLPSILSFF